jgi:hypothetical protein
MLKQSSAAAIVLLAWFAPAYADGVHTRSDRAQARSCGEDAFTYAEVTENRQAPPRGTPLVSIPDTLCADLVDERSPRIRDIQIVVDPRLGGDLPLGNDTTRRGERERERERRRP